MRPPILALVAVSLLFACGACGSSADGPSTSAGGPPGAAGAPPLVEAPPVTPPSPEATPPSSPAPPAPLSFVAVTFNTGMHDMDPDDDFSGSNAKIAEDYYGAGLSWNKAIADTKAWLAALNADVVAFQEIFDPEECPNIPADKKAGFVCQTWQPGDPSVAQTILGPGYQVVCHPGHHDNCVGVKLSFGKFQGCAGSSCPDGLTGAQVPTCGSGTRVGRGVLDLAAGGKLTVVSIHATSGAKTHDMECRTKQFKQIFEDLDGAPAANGTRNLVLGDFNTDPARLAALDSSAKALADYVGTGKPFRFITEVGSSVAPTYVQSFVPGVPLGLNIDHVVSDALTGSCWTAGLTSGHPAVAPTNYFDHKPGVCTVHE
jgi:Endonuclease/Exonuclease/phosphatase family